MTEIKQVGQLYGTEKEKNPSGGRVYDTNGIMRTLGSGHGMSQPMIAVKNATKDGGITVKSGGGDQHSVPGQRNKTRTRYRQRRNSTDS